MNEDKMARRGLNLVGAHLPKAAIVSGQPYAPYARRELRRRRLQAMAYVGLSLLAAVTAAVVLMALQR